MAAAPRLPAAPVVAPQKASHLALVAPEQREPEIAASVPAAPIESPKPQQHREAIELRGTSMLGLR